MKHISTGLMLVLLVTGLLAQTTNTDTLYFKDGTAMAGKLEIVQACAKEMEGNTATAELNKEAACSCMYETVAKYYTYNEFVTSFTKKKGQDVISKASQKGLPAYTEMMTCVTANMGKTAESTTTTSTTSTKPADYGAEFDKSFLKSCQDAANKDKDVKKLGVDTKYYCQCTLDKMKQEGLTLEQMGELQDTESPLFKKIIIPCLAESIGRKK